MAMVQITSKTAWIGRRVSVAEVGHPIAEGVVDLVDPDGEQLGVLVTRDGLPHHHLIPDTTDPGYLPPVAAYIDGTAFLDYLAALIHDPAAETWWDEIEDEGCDLFRVDRDHWLAWLQPADGEELAEITDHEPQPGMVYARSLDDPRRWSWGPTASEALGALA